MAKKSTKILDGVPWIGKQYTIVIVVLVIIDKTVLLLPNKVSWSNLLDTDSIDFSLRDPGLWTKYQIVFQILFLKQIWNGKLYFQKARDWYIKGYKPRNRPLIKSHNFDPLFVEFMSKWVGKIVWISAWLSKKCSFFY